MKLKFSRFILTASLLLSGILCLSFTINAEDSHVIDNLYIEGASFAQGEYKPGCTDYSAYVPYEMDTVKINVDAKEGSTYVVRASGERYEKGADGLFYIPVSEGNNYITLKFTNGDNKDTVSLTVNRMKSRETVNKELYRPQFHHTPEVFLANDPNGLVYNAKTGEYHLYYQYASGLVQDCETKVWAHAVSKDLVNWEERPVAILMDNLGEAYSGSAVVDTGNTSGLFDESVAPEERLVIVYTSYTGHIGKKSNGSQSQSIAYTTDGGNTWVKYEGNPVIPNPGDKYGGGFRDPKVLWFEDSSYKNGGIWVMIVGGGEGRLFTSENLIDWKFESTVTDEKGQPVVVECPDIFKITTDEGEVKWIYLGSLYNNAQSRIVYSVGELGFKDGKLQFITEESHMDESINGNCAVYAMQTFYNTPDGRRIVISWIRDWISYKEEEGNVKDWYGTHTLATVLHVMKKDGKYVLYETPVDETEGLRKGESLSSVKSLPGKMYEIKALINPNGCSEFGFELCKGGDEKTIVYYDAASSTINLDRSASGAKISEGGELISVKTYPDEDGNILLHIYVDRSIIDIFGNKGTKAINTQIYPGQDSDGIEFYSEGGDAKIESLEIYEMASMFGNEDDSPTEEENNEKTVKKSFPIGLAVLIVVVFLGIGIGAGLLIAKKK